MWRLEERLASNWNKRGSFTERVLRVDLMCGRKKLVQLIVVECLRVLIRIGDVLRVSRLIHHWVVELRRMRRCVERLDAEGRVGGRDRERIEMLHRAELRRSGEWPDWT